MIASEFGVSNESASTPIAIDAGASVPVPTITIDTTSPLPDRAHVTVHGTGFDPSSFVPFDECAGDYATDCLYGESGFAETDDVGAFDTDVWLARLVRGFDCATQPNRCRLWAVPYGDLDDRVSIGLVFDGSHPPVSPQATVDPATNLTHLQSVTVTATNFLPDAFGQIEQCAAAGERNEQCHYLTEVTVGADGSFTTTAAVSRRVGLTDCASAPCVVRVLAYPIDSVDVPVTFDASVPPPPVPSVDVSPKTDLVDRQVVQVQFHGVDPGTFAALSLCTADETSCGADVSENLSSADAVVPLLLPRVLGNNVDCAVVACVVRVQIYAADIYDFAIPVAFDPDAPLSAGTQVQVLPARGLWDRQSVEIRGNSYDPGADASVRQCISTSVAANTCGASLDLYADSGGNVSGRFSVRRVLQLSDGEHDCAVIACYLAVDGEPVTAIALGFDPAGPLHGSDLPPQPPCVAWPTAGWPAGPLPAGTDPAAVDAAAAQMVGPNAGDSVVVIHGGQLVYEKYADGITAATIEPSFSESKSFTSTIIGLLVDQGKLALDDRAPIPEWSGANDPRRAITLRNLLNMSSGLQWNEDYSGDTNSDVVQMVASGDESGYALAKPLQDPPGTVWHYSTGDAAILGRIIGNTAGVSGASYSAFLHDRLLDPLGINPVDIGFDSTGRWRSGWMTNTTTRSFAKLGLLYLRDGVWDNKQFLSPNWVDFVRTPGPGSDGMYGGQFWLNADGSFEMIGLYGQEVHIDPALDLIVAVNNGVGTEPMVDAFRNAQPFTCGAAPVVSDDLAHVRPLDSVDIDVLANDSGGHAGLAASTLTIAGMPAHGTAEIVGNKIRYTAGGGFAGNDTFGYVVCTNDRRQCLEAKVVVNIQAIPFRFLPPIHSGVNTASPARGVLVQFTTPAGDTAIGDITSVAVDCETGDPIGQPEIVDADLHVNPRRGIVSFHWATNPMWTGCRDLEVVTSDGLIHVAHFRWQTRRKLGERPPPRAGGGTAHAPPVHTTTPTRGSHLVRRVR